jgi:hypothetical protein
MNRTNPATLLHVHTYPNHDWDVFDKLMDDLEPVDPRSVEFMKLSRRMCLIRRKRAADATGFLVGADLMLTTAHALMGTTGVFADPGDVTLLFDQFMWDAEIPTPPKVKTPAPAKGDSCGLRILPSNPQQPDVVASSIKTDSRCIRRFDDNELDYILVRLDRPIGVSFLPHSDRIRGWNDCSRADIPAAGRVWVVQHPQGGGLQVAEGYIPANHDEPDFPHLFRYKTKTLNGSSGAAIINEDRRVLGIHVGERSQTQQLGVSFQAIFKDLENEGVTLPPFPLGKEVMESIFGSSEIEKKRHCGNDWRGDRLFDDLVYE